MAGALTQEAIDVAVILNALGARRGRRVGSRSCGRTGETLVEHRLLEQSGRAEVHLGGLDGARATGGRLDPQRAPHWEDSVATHERRTKNSISAADEAGRLQGLSAVSRAHREICIRQGSWLGLPMVYVQRMRTSTLCATPSV